MKLEKLNIVNKFLGMRMGTVSLMLLLALSGCMPDNDKDESGILDSTIALKKNKSLDEGDESFKELQSSSDSLQIKIDNLLKDLRREDSISLVEKNKKISDMRFPVFKDPQIKTVTHQDCINNGKHISLTDFVGKLQKKAIQGNKFLLEGSLEHTLFKDSLLLYSIFNDTNNIGQEIVTNMNKNNYGEGESPLTSKEEKKLYNRFLKYIEGKVNKQKDEENKRSSDVWNNVIKKEKRGGTTIYYTDVDKKDPGIIASHPHIQPEAYRYIWRPISPYNTADYYGLSYAKPKQNIVIIPQEIFNTYGITNLKDMSHILEKINNGKYFSEKKPRINASQDTTSKKQNTEKLPEYTQYYKIKKNGYNLLQIKDYGAFDNDKVRVGNKDYNLSKETIDINLNTLSGSKVIIEILNEGMTPPNTLMINLGPYKQKIEGKTGEIIILEFEK